MSKTGEEIVALALEHVCRRSFSSFSYDDISRELNITKAAVHYHFKNKEDLGVAVCDTVRERILAEHGDAMRDIEKGGHPWQFFERRIQSRSRRGICPIVSLQADYENLPERLRKALSDLARAEVESLRALVEAYHPGTDADAVAMLLLSLKGLLQYRRVMGDAFAKDVLKNIKEQFHVLVPVRGDRYRGR